MNLWDTCEGSTHIRTLRQEPWRVVEAQHISSSRDLVDTLEEHDLLEELLENSKPDISKQKDYLIFTPFRYPPLKYGSRFGHHYEPALWYGSLELETAFAEVAYYRLRFFKDSAADLGYIEIPMTAFKTYLTTPQGLDLTHTPFKHYKAIISHPTDYTISQNLGATMRAAKVGAFIYFSARSEKNGKNIAAFTPEVFQKKQNQYIHQQQNWLCMAHRNQIELTRIGFMEKQRWVFMQPSALDSCQEA